MVSQVVAMRTLDLLGNPPSGFPGNPLPLHPLNLRLISANREHGLQPFRLPLAIDSSKCLRCGVCAGYVCPTGAHGSAAQLLDLAQARGYPSDPNPS